MSVQSGQIVAFEFTTRNSSGVLTDASTLPTGLLLISGTDNAASVTITHKSGTGRYKASVTLPILVAGDITEIEISATVGSISDSAILWRDSCTGITPFAIGRAVTLTFRDSGGTAVPGVTFSVTGLGGATANGSGVAVINLPDGVSMINALSTAGTLFAPASITVSSSATAFTITGTAIATPAAPAEANDCVIYVDLEDSLGTETGKIKVEVPPTKLSNTRWVVKSTQTKTVDGSGRITFDPVPRGARVLVTVSAANISSEFLVPDTATHQV